MRYPPKPAAAHLPLGRAAECSRQLEAAVRFICHHRTLPRLSLIAHSWGSIVAGELAGRCPELIERLVFFVPIARRMRQASECSGGVPSPLDCVSASKRDPTVRVDERLDLPMELRLQGGPTGADRDPSQVAIFFA